LTKIYFLKHLK